MYNVSVSLDSKIYKIKNKIIKVNQTLKIWSYFTNLHISIRLNIVSWFVNIFSQYATYLLLIN